ncbi:MAG: porin [Sulfuricurvum sp.]|uniref:porin n=1 Tax=Sulfuricurvum sp. TaxID=2025608 RepID=UPI002736D3CA|nr:porin [Sulfuricurvum sp.]MDP2849497.1 porin [Sulfuricurvum sp.]
MKNLLLSAVAAMAITTSLAADEVSEFKAQMKMLMERLETLENSNKKQAEQTKVLTDELINVQNQTTFTVIDSSKDVQGLSPAASKVYYSKNPLSIGGYGELYYSKYNDSVGSGNTKDAYGDTYRFIPYIGYKFSDTIILNSEIEFEHGNEVAIEQLYVDFILDPLATIRVGHQLVPMGYVNLYHEPTLFNTVQRPDVEKQLIPSTWHELGLSVYGKTDSLEYQVGAFTALDMNHPTTGTPVSDKDWIRKARVGNESDKGMDNMAIVARLDYNGINGLQVGASAYTGKAGNAKVAGQSEEGQMTMVDIHATYQNEGFKARALYTQSHLSNADSYKTDMPESARGGYLNLEYNILPLFTVSGARLPLFFQYENYNLATKMANGASFGRTTSYTYGLNYFPHDQVVLKAEYMLRHNENSADTTKYINEGIYSLGLGFIF